LGALRSQAHDNARTLEISYNGFGHLTADKQAHGETVHAGTLKVEYAYTDGSANSAQPGPQIRSLLPRPIAYAA
jgi:hypothetical protein